MTTALVLASVRTQIADYIEALIGVYVVLIIAYLVSTIYLSVGGRIPYSRVSGAILEFLRDVTEPYLRFFRRFIPPIGGALDLSPTVGILVLVIVGGAIASAVHG
jgi:YggT family protein